MRVWMIGGFFVAAGLAAVAFLGEDGILSAKEAARVVAGQIPNSKCLPAGDCDGLNYNITRRCPNTAGWCASCWIAEGGPSPTIFGCRGGFPTNCAYPAGAYTDCGQLWIGLCNPSNECVSMNPSGVQCADARMCVTL